MPINKICYIDNEASAMSLFASSLGTLLHELGHYIGANSTNVAGGHIVIADGGTRGAFIVHEQYLPELQADARRHKLTIAGACVLESYACNLTSINRCRVDVDRYLTLFDFRTDVDDSLRGMIMKDWQVKYMNYFRSHRLLIRGNYELCSQIMSERNCIIDGYHVIPTSRLTPPHPRSDADRAREEEVVDTEAARRAALRQLVGEVDTGRVDPVVDVRAGHVSFVKPSLMNRISTVFKRKRVE
jgi:hypothetical protein